jgi:hypothetical protein
LTRRGVDLHNRAVPTRTSLALAVWLAAAGCSRAHRRAAPRGPATGDAIPHATAPIAIDGEWNEPDWPRIALRGQFRGSDGQLARPTSEVRFLHDDQDLIVALYAADENIQSSDAFDFSVGPLAVHVTATGKVTPDVPGVRAKVGFDEGTLDHPQDWDEEWVVELAIPLARTGLAKGTHAAVRASRCDTPKDNIERCASWSGSLTLR